MATHSSTQIRTWVELVTPEIVLQLCEETLFFVRDTKRSRLDWRSIGTRLALTPYQKQALWRYVAYGKSVDLGVSAPNQRTEPDSDESDVESLETSSSSSIISFGKRSDRQFVGGSSTSSSSNSSPCALGPSDSPKESCVGQGSNFAPKRPRIMAPKHENLSPGTPFPPVPSFFTPALSRAAASSASPPSPPFPTHPNGDVPMIPLLDRSCSPVSSLSVRPLCSSAVATLSSVAAFLPSPVLSSCSDTIGAGRTNSEDDGSDDGGLSSAASHSLHYGKSLLAASSSASSSTSSTSVSNFHSSSSPAPPRKVRRMWTQSEDNLLLNGLENHGEGQ